MVIPEFTPGSYKTGRDKLNEMISGLSEETLSEYPVRRRFDNNEVARLVNGNRSALDIKKMLDAQSRNNTDLEDIINFLGQIKKEAGIVYL